MCKSENSKKTLGPAGGHFPGEAQRELNGTRLMVHAGNCWQVFAVYRFFFT